MKTLLFMNPWEGLSFMLQRALKREEIEIEFLNSKDNPKDFKKHGIKSCPVLLVLDNGEVSVKLASVEEIVKYLKENV